MLLVRTRIAASPIHGIGLFADEFIARGTEVWRFLPGFDLEVEPDRLAMLVEHARQRFLHYGYLDSRRKRYVLCFDDARFINHSERPNVEPDYSSDAYGVDVAVRDIRPGDEITVDYSLFDDSRLIEAMTG